MPLTERYIIHAYQSFVFGLTQIFRNKSGQDKKTELFPSGWKPRNYFIFNCHPVRKKAFYKRNNTMVCAGLVFTRLLDNFNETFLKLVCTKM